MERFVLAHTWHGYLYLPPLLSYRDLQVTRGGNQYNSPRGNGIIFTRSSLWYEFRKPGNKSGKYPTGLGAMPSP